MYILKTKEPIKYNAAQPQATAVLYLSITSQEVNYIGGNCSFSNKYYRIENGVGKLVLGGIDQIPKAHYDGLVEATINPADYSLKFDDLQRAACMGALAIIAQNGTFGTTPQDWELIQVVEGDDDYAIHSSNIIP